MSAMDADFQATLVRVLTALGWKLREKCPREYAVRATNKAAICSCGYRDFSPGRHSVNDKLPTHDIPAPELTDALAWQVLVKARKLAAKVYAEGDVGRESRIVTALEGWMDFGAEDETAHTLILALDAALTPKEPTR